MTPIEKAVIEMLRAKDVVDGLSKEISDALTASFYAQPESLHGGKTEDWLGNAYKLTNDPSGGTCYVHHDGHIEEYLSEHCEHALRAHMLIQERKEARKRLGVARRRVSFMGRKLVDSDQQRSESV